MIQSFFFGTSACFAWCHSSFKCCGVLLGPIAAMSVKTSGLKLAIGAVEFV